MQDLDTEIIVATTRGPSTNTTAVAANVVVDERQMNALFLDVVSLSILNCANEFPIIQACKHMVSLVKLGVKPWVSQRICLKFIDATMK